MTGQKKENKKIYLSLGIISLVYLVGMSVLSNMQSLWMDDIAQIQIVMQDSLGAMLKENMIVDNNPPLSHLLSFFWIRLVPYGTGWLKLLNIILVSIGIFICGVVSYDLSGKWGGIATAVLAASDMAIVTLAAYTFRPYGLLFGLCALMMLAYERSRTQFNVYRNIIFLISMHLAVYTHYFAVFVSVVFFVFDVYLVFRKKLKIRSLYVYPVAALALLPWLLAVMSASMERLKNFWPSKPDRKILAGTWYELNGFDRLYEFMLTGLIAIFIVGMIWLWRVEKKSVFFYVLIITVPCSVIGFVYLLSQKSDNITSLFVSRYFLCVMPQVFLAGGIGMGMAVKWVSSKIRSEKLRRAEYFTVIFFLMLLMIKNELRVFVSAQGLNEQPFEEVAEYLVAQEDINSPHVLVFNTCDKLENGFDYYLTHKNTREGVEMVWHQITEEELANISKIYVVSLHLPFTYAELLEKNGFEKSGEDDYLPIQIYEKQ